MPPVAGGASRAETVRAALAALEDAPPATVLVHDAARPFATPDLFARVAAAAQDAGALPAEPVVDALWAGENGLADAPRPRDGLWRAQTPQGFPYAMLLAAHGAEAASGRPAALDDAEVVRRAGHPVRLVPGEADNFKITGAEDLVPRRAADGARHARKRDPHRPRLRRAPLLRGRSCLAVRRAGGA